MAERLRRAGYGDGVVFHGYHAYERVLSAFIAAQGVPVSPNHAQRTLLFLRLHDPTRPYGAAYRELEYLTVQVRNEALYYDEEFGVFPPERYQPAYVEQLLADVDRFARAVWHEIR